MVTINKDKLRNALSERYDDSIPISLYVNKVKWENIDDRLQSSLDLWLDNNQISDFNVNGVTFKQIMDKEKLNFIEALFSMNTLLNNPKLAEKYPNLNFRRDCLKLDINK